MEKIFVATLSKVTKDHIIKSNSVKKVNCILDGDTYINIEGEEPEALYYINRDAKNIDENKMYMISVKEYERTDNESEYFEVLKKALKTRQLLNMQKKLESEISNAYVRRKI